MTWIDVNDRLPESGRFVIIAQKNRDEVSVCYYVVGDNGENHWSSSLNISGYRINWNMVTHWMYAPDPPKSSDKK